jgi:hypothetical protein
MTVDDQLRQSLAALEEQVHDHVRAHHLTAVGAARPSSRRGSIGARALGRRRRWLGPALGALAVVIVVAGIVGGTRGTGPHRPAPAHPIVPVPAAPSQSPADAARDHVLSGIAALPFAVRVHPISPASSTQVPSPQGVWVLSGFDPNRLPSTSAASPCYGPDPAAGRRYQVCNPYGELLLLSADRRQILRAFPLPLPAEWLVSGSTGLYLGRAGDGALTDSMVCRVAAGTLRLTCRDFQARGLPDGPTYTAKQLAAWPGAWVIDRTGPAMSAARIAGDALVVSGPYQPATRLDLVTLAEKSS